MLQPPLLWWRPASHGRQRYSPGHPVGPIVCPTGVGHPCGGQWFPQPFMGIFPCPTQGQQPLLPLWQPLSSMQQLATLGLAQALPVRMPFWPWSALQPPSSGAPLVPPTGSQHPGGGVPSTSGPLSRRVCTPAGPLCSWGLLWSGRIPFRTRVITHESNNDSSPGSEWDGASEQGLDETPADQQLWSLAASLAQLGEYAPSALVEGGEVPLSQATGLTAAELALGAVAQPSTSPPSLRESSMVVTAVRHVQEEPGQNQQSCIHSGLLRGSPFWEVYQAGEASLRKGSSSRPLGNPQCHPAPLPGRHAPNS